MRHTVESYLAQSELDCLRGMFSDSFKEVHGTRPSMAQESRYSMILWFSQNYDMDMLDDGREVMTPKPDILQAWRDEDAEIGYCMQLAKEEEERIAVLTDHCACEPVGAQNICRHCGS